MSIANLRKLKKELLLIRKENTKYKFIVSALDGLFLIDLSKIDEGRITPVEKAPEGMDIEVIGANMDDILVCGGANSTPIFIIGDIPEDDIEVGEDKMVLNIVSVSSREEALKTL